MMLPRNRRAGRRAGWLSVLACLALLQAARPAMAAEAALPSDLAAGIDRAVSMSQRSLAADDALYASLGNPNLAATKRRQAEIRAEGDVAAAVLAAVAERPDLAAQIVDHAASQAPAARPAILAAVGANYPGLAGSVPGAAAVRSAAPPVGQASVGPGNWYSQPVLAQRGIPTAPPNPALPAATPIPVSEVPASWYDQPVLQRYAGAPAYPQPPLPPGVPPGPERAPMQPPDGRSTGNDVSGPEQPWDPLEPVNRSFHAFNEVVDLFILRPVAWLYGKSPDPIKRGIRNVLGNLNEPVVAANDVLQFTFADAGTSVGRFLTNSTVGVLGLFEVADPWFGLKRHHADFGQTLYSYGIGAGPYLELPLLGPSNLRDATGRAADTFLDPFTYLVNENILLGRAGVAGVSKREQVLDALDELRRGSLDYYASLRSAYYQNRQAELQKGIAGASDQKAVDDLFDKAN